MLIAAELHDLPEGSESGDSETATEVDVSYGYVNQMGRVMNFLTCFNQKFIDTLSIQFATHLFIRFHLKCTSHEYYSDTAIFSTIINNSIILSL